MEREHSRAAGLISGCFAFQLRGLLSLANFYLETKGFSESVERRGANDAAICIFCSHNIHVPLIPERFSIFLVTNGSTCLKILESIFIHNYYFSQTCLQ